MGFAAGVVVGILAVLVLALSMIYVLQRCNLLRDIEKDTLLESRVKDLENLCVRLTMTLNQGQGPSVDPESHPADHELYGAGQDGLQPSEG